MVTDGIFEILFRDEIRTRVHPVWHICGKFNQFLKDIYRRHGSLV
jgi:hypothetical protein